VIERPQDPIDLVQEKTIEVLANEKVMTKLDKDTLINYLKEEYVIETEEAVSIIVSNPQWFLSISFLFMGLKGILKSKEHQINVEPQIEKGDNNDQKQR